MAASLLKLNTLILLTATTLSAPTGDEVKKLPGLTGTLPWKQYSGYLTGMCQNKLHYWFIQSSSPQPENDPVVLWLNGGPGCSSMVGLLLEHGPFLLQKDQSLKMNPHSWNKVANMLYLESPVGVGYSYAKVNEHNLTYSDEVTAIDNILALREFFVKFPELKSNPLFIAGESYGGHYVPTLAELVVKYPEFNFQGFAVGNGVLDWMWFSEAILYFFYHHGIIGEKEWETLMTRCCKGNPLRCKLTTTKDCSAKIKDMINKAQMDHINFYNVYQACEEGWMYNRKAFDRVFTSKGPEPGQRHHHLMDLLRLRDIGYVCFDSAFLNTYMNQQEVRTALHIPDMVGNWTTCRNIVYERYNSKENIDMSKQFNAVLRKQRRILVYNGDMDALVTYQGNQWFLDDLNLTETKPYTPWTVVDKNRKTQNGGFHRSYKNLDFVTIKGAGHKAARDKPVAALKVIESFINDKPLD